MDRLDLFRIFIRLVDSGSFTRTADALAMPRSSVSAALKELEAHLGAQLIYRTTRKISPSQDGLALYERCFRLVAEADELESMFQPGELTPSGLLRINVPSRVGRLIIAPTLPLFFERYPGVMIEMGATDREVNLIEEGVDCVLRVGNLSDSGMIAQRVGDVDLINVASPAYLARFGMPSSPLDLIRHQSVYYASPTTGRVSPWEWLENDEEKSIQLKSRLVVNDAESYLAACLAGLGLVQIPAYDVKKHLNRGDLIEVLSSYRARSLPMTLLYHRKRHSSQCHKVFTEWLVPTLKSFIEI